MDRIACPLVYALYYVFVWHPSLAPLYKAPRSSQGVRASPCRGRGPVPFGFESREPSSDLGWVVVLGYAQYDQRKRVIHALAARFKMK